MRLTWTPKTDPDLMRASLSTRLGHENPHETQTPPLAHGSPAHPGKATAANHAPPAGPRHRHGPNAPAPPVRSAAHQLGSRRSRPAQGRTAPSAPQAGAGSLCTDRQTTGGGEPEERREPWRKQTQDPGGFRAADQGLATAPFCASAPDTNKRRAWPRPLARRGPWRGLRQRRPFRAQREQGLRGSRGTPERHK